MTVAPETEIAVVNRYRPLSGREPFLAAAHALAGRVEAEGHPGILSYRLYAPDGLEEARLVARYRDAEAWVGHHDLAMGWPEMAAFRAVAALERVELYGMVTGAMRDWIDRMGLAGRVWFAGPQVGWLRQVALALPTCARLSSTGHTMCARLRVG